MTSDLTEARDDLRAPRSNWTKWVINLFCAFFAFVHIWNALSPFLSELARNIIHFSGFAILAAYFYPVIGIRRDKVLLHYLDIGFGVLVALSGLYLIGAEGRIYERGVQLTVLDRTAIVIAIFGAIELTRRMTGYIIPVLIILALTYIGFWGAMIGGVFRFPGLSWDAILFRSAYGDDALFGTIARISSTYVFLFIIFGAFLLKSGAGEFVIDLARAIAGRLVGGPGIVAVIASAMTGTISGSAVANTASTGVITIPLMKRAGFDPKFAAGVEAAASTGGQIMPPIMGAGAFVMASLTQIPYSTIVVVSILPAMLYFLSVAIFVRIEAKRQNLPPLPSEGVTLATAFKRAGASFVIPITLLIGALVIGYSPTYAAVIGIVAVIVSSWITRTPMRPKDVFDALVLGTKNMIPTAILLCAVGLIVNVIATAGIGNTFSLMIANWSNGSVLIAIILIALASLVLGMGLPVTAAYIVLATLSAPALSGMIADRFVINMLVDGTLPEAAKAMFLLADPNALAALAAPLPQAEAGDLVRGLPLEIALQLRQIVVPAEITVAALLSAHMIIFWLSQDSNVTPPVALAAFTAAAIAKAPAMATGFASWKLAKGIYIVPLMIAYLPFLSGNWPEMLAIFFFGIFGIYGLAGAIQGYLEHRLSWPMRLSLAGLALMAFWPHAVVIQIIGAIGVVGFGLWGRRVSARVITA